jgi:hypothetical protein
MVRSPAVVTGRPQVLRGDAQGTFEYPWEQTLCAFGTDLIRALATRLTDWLPMKRAGNTASEW